MLLLLCKLDSRVSFLSPHPPTLAFPIMWKAHYCLLPPPQPQPLHDHLRIDILSGHGEQCHIVWIAKPGKQRLRVGGATGWGESMLTRFQLEMYYIGRICNVTTARISSQFWIVSLRIHHRKSFGSTGQRRGPGRSQRYLPEGKGQWNKGGLR